jgi:alpha-mannosidase
MTSLRRRGDWLELRLVAETPTHVTALVGAAGAPVAIARTCDLLGRGGQTLTDLPIRDGVLRLPMRPWQMLTVQLRLTTSTTTG